MSARHGGPADGHSPMTMPLQMDNRSPVSDTSGLRYGSTRVGPLSVQNQVLHTGTADWVVGISDATTDSGLYTNPPVIEPDAEYASTAHDGQPHSAAPDLSRLGTDGWCNGLVNVAPWFPGSRADLDLDVDVNFPRGPNLNSIVESHDGSYAEPAIYDSVCHDVSAADISESLPDLLDPTTTPSAGVTTCGRCGKQFTGQYRRGNYARHVKHQHRDALKGEKQRTCRECGKIFKRQDARRKHEWIVHRLVDAAPCPRKPTSTRHGSKQQSDADIDEMRNKLKISSSASVSNNHVRGDYDIPCYRVPLRSEQAHDIFDMIHRRLDIATYSSFCDTILARWEQIVEELRQKRSEAYGSFAKVLSDLSMQIRPEHLNMNGSYFTTLGPSLGQQNDAEFNSRPTLGGDRGKSIAWPAKSSRPSSKRTLSTNWPDKVSDNSGSKATTTLAEHTMKPRKRKVDCPVHKYYTMVLQQFPAHDQSQVSLKPPCGGCKQEFMSQIRHHLKSSEKHRKFFSALNHCERCHEDVIERCRDDNLDDQAWTEGNHKAGTCMKRDEPRDPLVICWARLYLAIFPTETSVPNPYTDEVGWLPANMVAPLVLTARRPSIQIQGTALADQSPSFLDDRQSHQHSISQADVASEQGNPNTIPETAAESTILNDVRKFAMWVLTGQANAAPAVPSSDEVEAEFRVRLGNLGWNHQAQDEIDNNSERLQGGLLSPTPVPPDNVRKYSIDAYTQPSTRYRGNTSISFPGSSRTSWSFVDDGSYAARAEPSWPTMMKIDPPESPFYPPPSERSAVPQSPFSEQVRSRQNPRRPTEPSNENSWMGFVSDDFMNL